MDRISVQLSGNCLFHLGDAPDAWQAWFDDSSWQSVKLPHDWSVTLPFSREYSSGTGYLAGGIGWYRIRIVPEECWRGKRISVTFDGIYKNSRVWCNSYYLGGRPNGYVPSSYDITEQFCFDRENIIAVCVDHREIADSRWFTGSGITRKVTLSVEEHVHPVPDGVFFHTPQVNPEEASYVAECELINCRPEAVKVSVLNRLLSPDDRIVSETACEIDIPADGTVTASTQGRLKNPSLWTPDAPNLYTLQTLLSYDTLDDTVPTYLAGSCQVGIRQFSFDPDKGFFLNGSHMDIKGVCVHHDAGCLGAAVPPAVWERRLRKLKEMGCNAIRMSHNPHMPELYDLCDSMGFLVMDEAFDEWEGPKNKWSTGHNVYPPKHQGYYIDFPEWHERDLKAMIRRDRNHPCVILWSIGNEIDYPNDPYCHASFMSMTGNNDANKPAAERQYNPQRPNAERLAYLSRHLCRIVRDTDTTHPVTLAAAFPELSAKLGFLDALDVAGFNYKEHLYAEHHSLFPHKPLLGSENGHTLSAWTAVTDNPYIAGQFLWTGIDYLGEAHGWPVHGSGAGLLTLAGFEKTSYYRRQSFWAEKPVLHLAAIREAESRHAGWGKEFPSAAECEFAPVSECWNFMPGESVVVKCYTNRSEAEFFLNGESLGTIQKNPGQDCILLTVPFAPGTLTARVSSDDGGYISHSLVTTGCACQIQLQVCESILYSSDSFCQIEAALLDAAGNRVYSDSTPLRVSVKGGRLMGLENGDLADTTDYSSSLRRAFHGQLLIYVSREGTEETTIQVRGEHLAAARLVLPSCPFTTAPQRAL